MTREEQIQLLVQYMQMKIAKRDWHAVADAACDIREIEAQKTAEEKYRETDLSS